MPRAVRPSTAPVPAIRRRGVSALAVLASAAMLGAAAIVPTAAQAAPGDAGVIRGQVFRDYNGNGLFDAAAGGNGPRELGLENVIVRAYDDNGLLVGETSTALGAVGDPGGAWARRGTYTLELDREPVAAGAALRVEFVAAGYSDTFSGDPLDDNASVRFITAPAEGADRTGFDFGVSTPEDYSTSAPPIVSAIESAGDPARTQTPTARDEPAIVAQYWNSYYTANGGQTNTGNGAGTNAAGVATSGAFPKRATLATFGQVGAVWGTAYQNTLHNVYAAATYKRLAGLGPLGIGGIYRVPVAESTLDGQRTVTGAGAVQSWLNVQGQPIANVPGATVDVGAAQSNAERGLGSPTAWTADADAFAKAGRIGIGSITVSADQQWLYFVNLNDRNLYRVDISDPSATAAAPRIERIGLRLAGGERPWALTEHHDRVYVGYVDEGTPWRTAASQGSAATVMSASIVDLDAEAATGTAAPWKTELEIGLGYQKGPSYNAGSDSTITRAPWLWRWNSWVDQWSNPATSGEGLGQAQPTGVGYNAPASWGNVQTYPQAILSDIEFSDTNDLVVGLMDRTSLQAGNRNRSADGSAPTTAYEAISSGDTLIAALNAAGEYVLESNGALVDGRVSARGSANEGIGGREFFADTNKIAGGSGEYHRESTLGGIAAKTGYSGLISAVIDPLNTFNVTGLKWLSADNGNDIGGYQQTSQQTSTGSNSFQKAGGLGNIQALSEEAPLQIGDRAWFDANRNGIQDAGEPALQGIVVTATPTGGGQTLTTTTDANGNYLFDSRDATPLQLQTDYVISFAKPAGVPATTLAFPGDPDYGFITWGDLALTDQRADEGAQGAIDSNVDPATGGFDYTTGAGGQNDHSLDVGYFADLEPTAAIEKFDGDVSPAGLVTREGADADTFADGVTTEPGDTRTVVIRLTNTGPEALKNVVLTDDAVSGAVVQSLRWWVPGETTARDAVWDAAAERWTYAWAETSDADAPGFPDATWAVGDEIIGEATLTLTRSDAEPHRDEAAFAAEGAISGNPVEGTDPYNAFTGGIQVIKFDGNSDATPPTWWDDATGSWVVPDKADYSSTQPDSDADTATDAVDYLAGAENTVRYVVTNTGNTWLTDVRLEDVTGADQPQVTEWAADLSGLTAPDGAPAGYPAELDVTAGAIGIPDLLFGPGQSFVVSGVLSLEAQEEHRDDITAVGTVVVPEAGPAGTPTGGPGLDSDGSPVRATAPGDPSEPFDVTDDDPFHARASAFFVQKSTRDGAAIDGSAFQLRDDDTSAGGSRPGAVNPVPVAAVDGEVGRFMIAGLAAGTYWLEEITAPTGHALLPQPVRIVVAADSTVTLSSASELVTVSTSAAGVSTVDVEDVAALVLPVTGANGPGPYLLAGALLLALALAVGVRARRRRAANT
ncbi:MAG: hypothetical protein K0R60_150 [Microbacterium sp.]|nr:hypothetical protein [Microbacterium sp.]